MLLWRGGHAIDPQLCRNGLALACFLGTMFGSGCLFLVCLAWQQNPSTSRDQRRGHSHRRRRLRGVSYPWVQWIRIHCRAAGRQWERLLCGRRWNRRCHRYGQRHGQSRRSRGRVPSAASALVWMNYYDAVNKSNLNTSVCCSARLPFQAFTRTTIQLL